jgi:hypothetical protein
VHDIEHSRLQCGRRDGVERLGLGVSVGRRGDVRADSELLYRCSEVLRDVPALTSISRNSATGTTKTTGICRLTFIAINLSTRYWVSTEMTTSASVCGSLSIRGSLRACVRMRKRHAS